MLNNIINKIRSILKPSDRENIKDVLEDLIEDNGNGTEKIDDGTKNIFKNVINLHNKCIEDVMIPRADIDAVSIETTLNWFLTNGLKNVFGEPPPPLPGVASVQSLF